MLHLDTCAQCQFTMLQSSKNREMSSRTHPDAQIVVLDRTARSRRNVPSTSSDAGAHGRVCVRAAAASLGRPGIAGATIGAPVVAPRAVNRPAALRLSAYGITRRAATG